MSESFNAAALPLFINRAVYQNMPPSDRARIEALDCSTPASNKPLKPTPLTQPAPQAPGAQTSAVLAPSEPVELTPAKPGFFNRLGAQLASPGAKVKTFWQKIVSAIVSGASAIGAQLNKSVQMSKSFLAVLINKSPAASPVLNPKDVLETFTSLGHK